MSQLNLFDNFDSEMDNPFYTEGTDLIELQSANHELFNSKMSHSQSLSEEDKINVRQLLKGWNLKFLFQTFLGE